MNEREKTSRRNRQARSGRGRGLGLLFGSGGILIFMLSLLACAPQTRYEVLSFFFDGVPDPNIRKIPVEKGAVPPSATRTEFQEQMATWAKSTTRTQLNIRPTNDSSPYSVGEKAFARHRADKNGPGEFHHEMEFEKCQVCHDLSRGMEPKVRFAAEFCDQCHAEKRKREGRLHDHGPYRMAHCFPCHQSGHTLPVAVAEAPRKPASEQCLECHDKDSEKLKLETTLAQEALANATTTTVGVLPTLEGAANFEARRSTTTLGSFAHHQMEKDKCLICHNEKDGLKPISEPTREFCDQCHGEKRKAEGWNHASINLGDCRPCHTNGHESPYPKLLKKSITDTCLFCHQEGKEKTMSLHTIKALRVDTNNCTACHDPHKVF